jgi:hypothetical protein
MVGFFSAGLHKLFAKLRVARSQGLSSVKRLGAYLTHMVHPHQSAGLSAFSVSQRQCADALRGVWPGRVVLCKNSAQALV